MRNAKPVRALPCVLAALFLAGSATAESAESARKDWAETAAPEIISILAKDGDPARVVVSFTLDIGTDGADSATVEMSGKNGEPLDSKQVGRSKRAVKTAEFAPASSGAYFFKVIGSRAGEASAKESAAKPFAFSYPLGKPVVRALNAGNGTLRVSWSPVHEADRYVVTCRPLAESAAANAAGSIAGGAGRTVTVAAPGTDAEIPGLEDGTKYGITVTAMRGKGETDRAASPVFAKTVKSEKEREWQFTWFGQSSNGSVNTMEMLDSDNLRFRLNSCTFDAKSGQILQKGGKFTAFHDGISYYYTEIDPKTENFSLTATFTVDYINTTADGQEGFGIVAMDSLGEHGVSMKNHYTNSASIIATKYEATVGGVKKTCKDTVGARFVSGLTAEVLASGDSGIAKSGTCAANAFSYDQADLVKAGDRYALTLKKTNTGYHAILAKEYATEETVTEYIMYGSEKLLALDGEKIYVGFAAARGCNVTVSDVSMKITDPATDPPALREPSELVPLVAQIDSPSTYTSADYPFAFASNADGKLTVKDKDGKAILENARVVHGRDFTAGIALKKGINDFTVTFAPDPEFRPGEKQVIAAYDRELKKYVESYAPVSIAHTVIFHSYDVAELRAAPDGTPFGKGTAESPLDIASAINYAKPGQPIILKGGNYFLERAVMIDRGNSGKATARKSLASAPGERAVLDFSNAAGGMTVAGDWWTIDGIDVRSTAGNVKGIQVSGDSNIISRVNTYRCGDTGLQISGSSAEPFEKWPANNLVKYCTSHDNCDPAQNNADGFAAKLTCGEGNAFLSCVSYSNIDDGWDLFSKIESGPIGAVVIDSCVAYKNGSLSDGSGNGDGNGFKLGGDGIAVAHILKNSVSFANGASGITSNSDPAVILVNVTSYGNGAANVNLYGKGEGSRLFKARGVISMAGGAGDVYREMPELASPDNWFWNGAKCVNSEGRELKADIFASADTSKIPGRRADGSIDMGGLFALNEKAPANAGASLK